MTRTKALQVFFFEFKGSIQKSPNKKEVECSVSMFFFIPTFYFIQPKKINKQTNERKKPQIIVIVEATCFQKSIAVLDNRPFCCQTPTIEEKKTPSRSFKSFFENFRLRLKRYFVPISGGHSTDKIIVKFMVGR